MSSTSAREGAAFTHRPDSRYEVTLTLGSDKIRAETIGKESEVPMRDIIEKGVFAERPRGGRTMSPQAPRLLRRRCSNRAILKP